MPTTPTEAETRDNWIDRQLDKVGWSVARGNVLTELPLSQSQTGEMRLSYQMDSEFADYALLGRDRNPIAIVEAKRTSRDALAGKRQAADYADHIRAQYSVEPFIFLSNGETIWFWDRERSAPRKVSGFFTLYDLERLLFQREHRLDLKGIPIDTHIVDRPYQHEAIRRVYEQLAQGHRKFLLVMATGTGKTRTTVALIDGLLRARWAQKVLFLADRRELVKQALGDIKDHLPNESRTRIEGGEVDYTARIFVATYPSLMQALDEFSPGYFDLIIADESHRSIYNRYRAIFERFDALQLGLTATPTEFVDHNTFELFDCPTGLPTFVFPYETAVAEEYLADYRVMSTQTRFQLKGIKAGELPPEVQKQIAEQGIELSEVDFEGTDLERRVTNSGTNDALVREFMDKCIKDETGAVPRKSIFFAVSHRHAVALWESFNRLYPQYKGRLAELIDSHMERAEKSLDDFKREDMPRVAISIDMLDTGIDVPAICNLVFAKPVYSRVKFWQMVGRGTRRYRDPHTGWEKKQFLILDFWDNFAYFNMHPEGEIPIEPEAIAVRLFGARLDKLGTLLRLQKLGEAQQTLDTLRADIASLPRDAADVREYARELEDLRGLEDLAGLTASVMAQLKEVAAPLMRYRPVTRAGGAAMAFALQTERLARATLNDDEAEVAQMRAAILDDLAQLPLTLNEVKAVESQLHWAQSDGFWQHLDYARAMSLQADFASLMRYRQPRPRNLIELDLPDEVIDRRWITYGPAGEGSFVETYRAQVEARIKEIADAHPTVIKLRRGETPTGADIQALARTLNTPDLYVTEQTLRAAYNQPDASVADFVRHILGVQILVDREARIKQAFDEF
ncbi:MAG: DEAD/DEAH box helicase family protein, partial [Chloroflexota bacterium]